MGWEVCVLKDILLLFISEKNSKFITDLLEGTKA